MTREDRYPAALGLIIELVVVLNQDMTRSLARDELTTSRVGVLWRIRRHGPSTQSMLAESMGVSARTMTGLVDGLVATGFVTREPHPTDRRATLVTFTDRAARTVESLEREQTEFTDLLFADLSDDAFDGLTHGLEHVLAQIRAHLPPTPDTP